MNFITIRYNCAVALPVFSCLIFYTMLFVWSLQKAGLIDGNFLKITCIQLCICLHAIQACAFIFLDCAKNMTNHCLLANNTTGLFMNLNNFLHSLSLYILVITCDVFYTSLLMWGIEMIITLDHMSYWALTLIVFLIILFLSIRYSVPELRKVW